MKKFTLFFAASLFCVVPVLSQDNDVVEDSLAGFDLGAALQQTGEAHDALEAERQIAIAKRNYIDEKYHLGRFASDYHYPGKVTNNAVFPVASCTNADFENGDFTGWGGLIGDNQTSCFAPFSNQQIGIFQSGNDAPVSNSAARHTIITPAFGNDPYGLFPGVPTGSGNYTVRLGGQTPNYQGEQLFQTFTVSPLSTSFAYRYAVIFNDPPSGHLSTSKPYFRIEMLDQNGQPISNCTQYFDTSGVNRPGFVQSATNAPNGDPVFYKAWTTINFDLTNYVGQDVTIRFTVAGCTQSGHFGYAYVDCSCSNLAASVNFCPGNTTIYLTAPNGYGAYQWLDPNHQPIPGETNDTLIVSNPNVGDTFYVYLVSAVDTSCHNTLPVALQYTHIFPNATADSTSCYGYADGQLHASGAMGFAPYSYVWNTTPQATTANVTGVLPGTYIVDMTDSLGCEAWDTVTIYQPLREDTSNITYDFCYGDPRVTLTAPGSPSYIDWIWIGPNGDTLANGTPPNTTLVIGPAMNAEYSVILIPPTGCPVYDSAILNFNPPVKWFSPDSLVNVFTPNGDMRNDYFYPYYSYLIANQTSNTSQPAYDFTDLYIATFEMWVYDRWGNQVYYTNDYNIGWNGQAHGKDCSDGVYYWITKYTSRCSPYDPPVEDHGFVHLIRNQ